MSKKNVVGVFATSFEAMKAINSLKHDGIDSDHIYVVANDELKSNTIEEKNDVQPKGDTGHTAGHDRFWNELKSFVTNSISENTKFPDHFLDLGMTEADVDRYINEVENGKILILVDSDEDLGRTGILSTENMPMNHTGDIKVHGEKVDNFTTGARFGRNEDSTQKAHFENRAYQDNKDTDFQKQPGRPKERQEGVTELQSRQREYEEEVNPFENRYPSGYSADGNEQPDYGNNPS